jgi:hypothetical protein
VVYSDLTRERMSFQSQVLTIDGSVTRNDVTEVVRRKMETGMVHITLNPYPLNEVVRTCYLLTT